MATKIASKIARVRRYAVAHNLTAVAGRTLTDRDYRKLVHDADRSPRRAIRNLQAMHADLVAQGLTQ